MAKLKGFYFKVGDKVHWTDPEKGEGDCSGNGTIVLINAPADEYPIKYDDTIISLRMKDGGEIECLPHEIKKIKK